MASREGKLTSYGPNELKMAHGMMDCSIWASVSRWCLLTPFTVSVTPGVGEERGGDLDISSLYHTPALLPPGNNQSKAPALSGPPNFIRLELEDLHNKSSRRPVFSCNGHDTVMGHDDSDKRVDVGIADVCNSRGSPSVCLVMSQQGLPEGLHGQTGSPYIHICMWLCQESHVHALVVVWCVQPTVLNGWSRSLWLSGVSRVMCPATWSSQWYAYCVRLTAHLGIVPVLSQGASLPAFPPHMHTPALEW